MEYKVYIHRTKTDGRIFYVGCGKKYRPYKIQGRSKDWFSIYENEGLIVEILYEVEDKDVVLFLEAYLIQEYKRICDGGTLVNKALYDHSIGIKGEKHSLYGKKLSDEHKRKISESSKNLNNKPIMQYNKDGTFIREWKSITTASNSLNIHGGNITTCCRGKRKSAGGYVWKYKT